MAKGEKTTEKKGQTAKEPKTKEPKAKEPAVKETAVPPRLKERYHHDVVPKLMEQFGFKSPMRAPRIDKIVINQGLGEAIVNPKVVELAAAELGMITGQKAVIRRARKAISNFKLRQGVAIGCSVTLRGAKMYEFLDRLTSVALPRVRDFRGVPTKSFDGQGNYTLGIKEQIIFPEIDYDKVDKIRGMNITICTSARTDEEGAELLRLMGMPFRKRGT